MTDENTSGGQTLPHDHTSLPEQGGKLDFDNVTESSNLTNGDMTFANASGVMQRITNGNVVGDVLTNNALGVPEFSTPASGGITNPITVESQSRDLDDWIKACL
jgi:hypothetical protein|tara:strand:+ start:1001 stop:1312 length:312 start_codon:yes stop_codon:yes gene_type:complete